MKKKLIIILAALVFGLFSVYIITPPSRPNVVLIIIDTLRADKLGCYGFPGPVSPEIDKIARNGVLFKNVISQSSWTRPSIGSMLTSLYPRSLGLYKRNFEMLNDKYKTLPEILKANGYTTIGITANPIINSLFNFDQGFDLYIDSDVIWWWMVPKEGEVNKSTTTLLHSAKIIFQRFFYAFRSLKSKGPFYLQINIMEVHEPGVMVRPEFQVRKGKNAEYLNAISQVSHDINEFIERLLSTPGWENTLFVITSDHGEGLDDHPSIPRSEHHGFLLYESILRVPLILYHRDHDLAPVRWVKKLFPGIFRHLTGNKIDKPVRLMDLMPTILDYLKIPVPDNIHGKSLLGLIDKSSVQLPQYFVAETLYRGCNKIAVYSDKWKYIENYDGHEGVNKFELQPVGKKENGKVSDMINKRGEEALPMKEFLRSWEKRYPKVKPTPVYKKPSPEVLKQLKALGYLN